MTRRTRAIIAAVGLAAVVAAVSPLAAVSTTSADTAPKTAAETAVPVFDELTAGLAGAGTSAEDRTRELPQHVQRDVDALRRELGAADAAVLEIGNGSRYLAFEFESDEQLEFNAMFERRSLRYRNVLLLTGDDAAPPDWARVVDAVTAIGGEPIDGLAHRVTQLRGELLSLRTQIEDHHVLRGSWPRFEPNGWSALLPAGPSLAGPPVNPLAAPRVATTLVVIDVTGADGTAVSLEEAGWVWNETDHRLFPAGTTEEELIERIDRALIRRGRESRESILVARLGQMRSAIAIFYSGVAVDGDARYPTLAELRTPGTVVEFILSNPFAGSAVIQPAVWSERNPPVFGTAGWNYDATAGRLWANSRIAGVHRK